MRINSNELICGGIFIAFGLAFGGNAWIELPLGTAFRMGPGYFPLVLSGLLVLLGAGIIVSGLSRSAALSARAAVPAAEPASEGTDGVGAMLGPYRGVIVILIAPIIFGFCIERLGMIPALILAVLTASFASRFVSFRFAVVMTALLTLFCYLVFSVGLKLPARLFGPWLDPLLHLFGAQ